MSLPFFRKLSSPSRGARALLASTLVCAAVGIGAYAGSTSIAHAQVSTATADGTPDIDASLADKNWAAALTQLDARLKTNPRDVQAKFKHATVLARMNRDDDAIAAFTELTHAYPELPEPYNNLAALYAKKGRYEDARNALETATKANPGYALAYDNLGDLYLRLASESYKRAQSLGSKSPLTRQHVTDIQKIITPPPANRKAGAYAAGVPRAASGADDWTPMRDSNSASPVIVPLPDSFSPFGGPSNGFSTPYVAPNAQTVIARVPR